MEKNVIFGNNDNLLGYAEDVLKYLESLVQQNETELYNEAINELKTKIPTQFVEVWYNPMGCYVVRDVTLIDSETKTEI